MRILVVEDEVKLASLIRRGLREEGMLADVAIKGEDALWMAVSTEYDVLIVDWMLPGIDGVQTAQRLRADGVDTPILMLTARDSVPDRITGLNAGADDYLPKPFAFGELVARVHALARRSSIQRSTALQVDDLRLDADPQPIPRQTRPHTSTRDQRPITTRQLLASVRTRHREHNQSGRYRGLKVDSFVNPSTV